MNNQAARRIREQVFVQMRANPGSFWGAGGWRAPYRRRKRDYTRSRGH